MSFNRRKIEVDKILSLAPTMEKLTNDQLKAKTEEFRTKKPKDIKTEAFAVVREAAKRTIGLEAFPVQLQGALALYDGNIVEMKTGEGKTLASIFPAYVHALSGKGVHIITVNEYLTTRDAKWMGQVFEFLGMSVGVSLNDMSLIDKKEAYKKDITYVTNTEIGFDFLRGFLGAKTLRELNFCIIDEVDSILIDEARTPLIISQSTEDENRMFLSSQAVAEVLQRGEGETELSKIDTMVHIIPDETGDYLVDEKNKAILMTEQGVKKVEEYYGISNFSAPENMKYQHHIIMSLKAKELMHKDRDYIVHRGKVEIVDEFTGRILKGRRFSDGLHEALEAKEKIPIEGQTYTAAKITYQSFFNMYQMKSGMSGTVCTDKKEFKKIYDLKVEKIPTNKPVNRTDHEDQVYATKKAKNEAILREVVKVHKEHRPILIGTTSVKSSEEISSLLKDFGLQHEVLNAKNHYREAQIIAKAGQYDAITVATNMAGRGTDIVLSEGVAELGGLMVIGTGKHDARRIDDQLRGRAGRQGDPGESIFFVSLEDEFIRQYGTDLFSKIIDKIVQGEELGSKSVRKQVLKTQKRIEQNHYGIRKNLHDYDEIDIRQFKSIIREKERVNKQFNVSGIYLRTINQMCKKYSYEELKQLLPLAALHVTKEDVENKIAAEKIKKAFHTISDLSYEDNKAVIKKLKYILSLSIVTVWAEHIQILDDLKKTVPYQGIGKNPLDFYKIKGYKYYSRSIERMREMAVMNYFN